MPKQIILSSTYYVIHASPCLSLKLKAHGPLWLPSYRDYQKQDIFAQL